MTHESQYDTEIKYRIDVAKDLFQKESIFDDKARQYLSFAFRMLTNGKKYERPKELEEFVTPGEAQEKARKYANELVDKALSSLEDGNELETAKLLLELVLMIVTPISG
jgi:geranylgeranyl pyrophosphate synthase